MNAKEQYKNTMAAKNVMTGVLLASQTGIKKLNKVKIKI